MERRIRTIFFFSLVAAMLVGSMQSCYYDKEIELYGISACDTLAAVTYTAAIAPIMVGNCAISGCHTGVNPTGGLLLNTYGQVKAIADDGRLESRVLVQKNMPPTGPLTPCEQEAIQKWINAGAPEN